MNKRGKNWLRLVLEGQVLLQNFCQSDAKIRTWNSYELFCGFFCTEFLALHFSLRQHQKQNWRNELCLLLTAFKWMTTAHPETKRCNESFLFIDWFVTALKYHWNRTKFLSFCPSSPEDVGIQIYYYLTSRKWEIVIYVVLGRIGIGDI